MVPNFQSRNIKRRRKGKKKLFFRRGDDVIATCQENSPRPHAHREEKKEVLTQKIKNKEKGTADFRRVT